MEPKQREIHVHVETKIPDEKYLIIDELKALYLPFKKVDLRKLRGVTKKVNTVIGDIETDDVTHKLAMAAALWVAKEVGVKNEKLERKESHGGKEELKVALST